MYAFINYLIQVSILTLVFITLYHFVFRKQTLFRMNRLYLLSGLVLSWIIPLINIPIFLSPQAALPQIPNLLPTGQLAQSSGLNTETSSLINSNYLLNNSGSPFPWWILYWIGSAFVFFRSILVILKIINLRYRNASTRIDSSLIITGRDLPAFSFFKWIFLNEKQFNGADKNLILEHELAHSKQHHTYDLILAEIIHIFLWFNPLIIVYKNALKECHEFLADEAVLGSGVQLQTYSLSLKKELFAYKNQKLASYFRGSTLKKRMIMATKEKSKNAVWKYILVLPILALTLLSFSFVNDPIDSPFASFKKDKFIVLIDPGHGGKDFGYTSENGWKEKDIVLDIAKTIKKEAGKEVRVILTRKKDEFMSIHHRVKKAKEIEADLFISLHMDSSSNTISYGWTVFYSPFYQWSDQSAQVAQWITEDFSILDKPSRVKPQQAPFKIIQETLCPAFLINFGFINGSYYDQEVFFNPEKTKQVAKDFAEAIVAVKAKMEANLTPGDIQNYKKEIYRGNGSRHPIEAHELSGIGSVFGEKYHPILKVRRKHPGIDLLAPLGTTVYPKNNGIVKDIKRSRSGSGYGTWILIEHPNNIESFYAHLDECYVEIGDSIFHQPIGTVGQTGMATMPHLHYEIRKDGKPTSYVNYLVKWYNRYK